MVLNQFFSTMNKVLKTVFLAAIVLAGCKESAPFEESGCNGDVFYASIEGADVTKTYVDNDLHLFWTAGDRVSIFMNTYNQQYEFNGKTGDNSGSFSKITSDNFVTGSQLDANYAVYPYSEGTSISYDGLLSVVLPETQTYAENTFGLGSNMMVAVTSDSEDNMLCFKNLCGYIVLKLYGAATVKSIEFRGNDNEKLAGAASVVAEYGKNPVLTMSDTATSVITMDCGEGVALNPSSAEASEFWFCIPPVTFSKGFTVTVTDVCGEKTTKSATASYTLERNVVWSMTPIGIQASAGSTTKLTFDALGGKFADGSSSKVIEGAAGDPVSFAEIPSWGENQFVGWNETLSVFPEQDATVTAIWNSMDIEISTNYGSAAFKVVRVPAGTYKVGSPDSEPGHIDDEFQHDVTFTKDYYIGTMEFPQKAWEAVTGTNPSLLSMAYDESADNNPVNFVAWQDICGENGDYGEDSFAYKLRQAVKESMGVDFEFRLPTEAEWETAARGGQTESLPFGIGTGRCLYWYMANFGCAESAYDMDKSEEWDGYVYDEEGEENVLSAYTPGGYYQNYVNGYGCYDFHGNLAEWCWDWYDDEYYHTAEAALDPQGPAQPGNYGNCRVLRGGWCMPFSSGGATSGGLGVECRSACRGMYPLIDSKKEWSKGGPIGFRICFTGFNK